MTLSHCWGTTDIPTLRESCIDSMKEGIVWSSLPKTFQDAVTVTMWFKIKYLWVDSLCIIQDSHEDWERESKTMKHVYQNSFLTIAATKAADATGGLFVDRNPDLVQISTARASWPRELEGDYLFVEDAWELELLDSPLLKRAWVCQERLLSPRVLHFGRSQMYWECQDLDACETFPENLPPECDPSSTLESKRLLLLKDGDFYNDYWSRIITLYSKGNLTRISDKCVAFAGIVEEIQGVAQSRYLAGLWEHNLEQQLLWYVSYNPPAGRPSTYLAPSWSWLSIDGGVMAARVFQDDRVVLEILDVNVTHFSESIRDSIKNGYIHARGILGRAVWRHRHGKRWEFRPIRGCRPSSRPGQAGVFTDEMVDEISHDAVYLPVILSDHNHLIMGLLLTPTGEAKSEYQRIGVFSISGEEDCKSIMETKTRRGLWRSMPRRTFTLV